MKCGLNCTQASFIGVLDVFNVFKKKYNSAVQGNQPRRPSKLCTLLFAKESSQVGVVLVMFKQAAQDVVEAATRLDSKLVGSACNGGRFWAKRGSDCTCIRTAKAT